MSLAVNDRRVDFVGNNVTTAFSYDFKIYAQDYLQVIVTNDATEVQTTLVITTDYTVAGVGASTGGTVTLVDANQAWLDAGSNGLKTGYTLTIVGSTPFTQTTDIRNQGPYYPSLHEDAFDKLTMLIQELNAKIRRAPLFAYLAGVADRVFPNPDPGKAIIWGATGQLENTLVDINAIDAAITSTTASAAAAAASQASATASQAAASASAALASTYIGASINLQDYGSVLNANLTIPSNATYSFIRVNSAAASRTITLPAANAVPAGRKFTIWDAGGNAGSWPIVVSRAGADTIEGSTSISLSQANIQRTFISDGTSRWSVSTLKQQEVTATNILDTTISAAKLASDSVTTAKILNANVTRAKLEAVGQQLSASSGTFSGVSATAADVTNLTVTITTTGRPVFVGLVHDGTTNAGYVRIYNGSTDQATGTLNILRATTVISSTRLETNQVSSAEIWATYPVSSFSYIEPIAAGTYTYKVQYLSEGATATDDFRVYYAKLLAFEL